jgi:hypothetical protein
VVASLTQPGRITGVASTPVEIEGERLQLLKGTLPTVSRVAVLDYSSGTPRESPEREVEAAARVLGVTLHYYGVRDPKDLAGASVAMTKKRTEALFEAPDPFSYVANRVQRIVEHGMKHQDTVADQATSRRSSARPTTSLTCILDSR